MAAQLHWTIVVRLAPVLRLNFFLVLAHSFDLFSTPGTAELAIYLVEVCGRLRPNGAHVRLLFTTN